MDDRKTWNELRERRFDKSIQVGAFFGGFILAALTSLLALGDPNHIFCTNTADQTSLKSNHQYCDVIVQLGRDHPSMAWLDYREIITGAMGLVGALFIISVYGMKRAYVHHSLDRFADYSHILYELGFIGILIIFPFIVMPYSILFGVIIASVAWVWVAMYVFHYFKERHTYVESQNISNLDTNLQTKSRKTFPYRIEQTPRGVLITVNGDAIDEVVADYSILRVKLEQEGFKIAPDE